MATSSATESGGCATPVTGVEAGRRGISWDGIGPYLRLPDGRLLRDRKQATDVLGTLAEDPTVAMLLGLFLTGRQDGLRSSMSRELIGKALLVLGLVDSGMSIRGGVHRWLVWECEFGGALRDQPRLDSVPGPGATLSVSDAWVDYLDTQAAGIRRTWKALGLRRLDESVST